MRGWQIRCSLFWRDGLHHSVIIVGGCWFAWRHQSSDEYIDYFAVSLRIIGVLALILTSCGLAAINADDIWYFASGGVIGSLLSTTLQPLLHSSGELLRCSAFGQRA